MDKLDLDIEKASAQIEVYTRVLSDLRSTLCDKCADLVVERLEKRKYALETEHQFMTLQKEGKTNEALQFLKDKFDAKAP